MAVLASNPVYGVSHWDDMCQVVAFIPTTQGLMPVRGRCVKYLRVDIDPRFWQRRAPAPKGSVLA